MMGFDLSLSGSFFGYASIFNSADLAQDVIMPGAFARSLRKRGADRVRMLYQHDAIQPIGKWHRLEEDDKGLLVEGSFLLNVKRAYEIYMLLKAQALDGLSIGFRTIRASSAPNRNLRYVYEIDLVEISIVTFPMHPQARVKLISSDEDFEPLNEKQLLRQDLQRASALFHPSPLGN